MLNLCVLDLRKRMDLLEFMMELGIWYYLEVKNMILFATGLDISWKGEVVLNMLFLMVMQKSK